MHSYSGAHSVLIHHSRLNGPETQAYGFILSFVLSVLDGAEFLVEIHLHPQTKMKEIAGAAAGRYCGIVSLGDFIGNFAWPI